jgi:hypothetical protein
MPTQHQQQLKVRKGANGVLLKKFETVLCDIYSSSAAAAEASSISSPTETIICPKALQTLTPRYSKLPPFLDESEQDDIVQRARRNSSSSLIWCKNEQLMSSSPWPFDERTALPSCGCVRDNSTQQQHRKPRKTKTGKDVGGVGDIYGNHQRAFRKEMQLSNMIQCVFSLLPDHILHDVDNNEEVQSSIQQKKRKFRIVDFAGGTGHLSVPLALLLPHCEVVCVDLKKWSLDLLHRRVDGMSEDEGVNDNDNNRNKEVDMSSFHQNTLNGLHKSHNTSNTIRVSQNIPNLSTYLGSIQSYNESFDIGISLHACGEASDYVLRKCLEQKASWVVCSCCCGKLQSNALNPYTFQSTGINEKGVFYPQSKALASFMNTTVDDVDDDDDKNIDDSERRRMLLAERFDEVARAADYSELGDARKPRNACRRAAKSLVEWDRLLYCKEYDADADCVNVVLTRMIPWEASTKNDILIGWYDHSCNPYRRRDRIEYGGNAGVPEEDPSSQVDFEIALQHLFGGHGLPAVEDRDNHANDWSSQEVTEIQMQLEAFLSTDMEKTFRFQRGMGSRKRKLVHYVAEKMGLRHWGEGKKDSEKIVVVARRKIE